MDDVIPPVSYAPDGLYESDIDALIAEYFTADETSTTQLTVSDRVATTRHFRRFSRQTISAALRVRSVISEAALQQQVGGESDRMDTDGAAA